MDYLANLARIAYAVMGPIILLVGAGYLAGRRVPTAAEVLAKILLYFLIPVFVFQNIVSSSIEAAECGTIVLFSVLTLAALYGVARVLSAVRRHDRPLRGAFANTIILYNSANFAIPVMALAFTLTPEENTHAVAIQVIVGVCQGVAAYVLGAFLAAAGSGPVRHAAMKVFRIPFIYAVVAALVLKHFGIDEKALAGVTILWKPVSLIAPAYVPIALMTLGAQMACVKLVRAPVDLGLAFVGRLVVGPLVGLGLVMCMGLQGTLGQVLVIGVAGPTAIASVVVAIEYRNRPDFASSAVFLSTLGAGLSVPLIIFLAQMFL
jgi:malate permease and related proteins